MMCIGLLEKFQEVPFTVIDGQAPSRDRERRNLLRGLHYLCYAMDSKNHKLPLEEERSPANQRRLVAELEKNPLRTCPHVALVSTLAIFSDAVWRPALRLLQ